MKNILHIAKGDHGVGMTTDAVTQSLAILAKRGAGKTYTGKVMAEEFCKHHLPFVVLDPTGAWWGLRSSADGQKPGYPVTVIGGAHGDIPLEDHTGKLVAEFVVDNPGHYVIDLSGTDSNAAQDRFATDFAERLYRLKAKHPSPLHLFVDEADSFAPQRPMPGQQKMLGAFEALVRRGRIRGIGITMISQRPAVINKNILTQIETLIVLQMTGPQDIAAIDEWIKLNATKEERAEFLSGVAKLHRGEAWFWSPAWLECFEQVRIRELTTFDSSATPKAGEQAPEPKRLAAVDLDALRTKMAATIERAKSEDPAFLKKQISDLEDKLRNQPTPEPVVEVQTVEVLSETTYVAISSRLENLDSQCDYLENDVKKFTADLREKVAGIRHFLEEAHNARPEPKAMAAAASIPRPPQSVHSVNIKGTWKSGNGVDVVITNSDLPSGERKVLVAIAQANGHATREYVTIMAGYKKSSRDEYIRRLTLKGYLTSDLTVTNEGLSALGNFERLPTGEALRLHWLGQLPQGEALILGHVMKEYPRPIDRETLGDRTQYKKSSRDEYIRRLSMRQLVTTGPDGVKASAHLF